MYNICLYSIDNITACGYNILMFSVPEAAMKIGISERQLRFLLEKGKVEGKKLGRDWVVLDLNYTRKRKPKEKRN